MGIESQASSSLAQEAQRAHNERVINTVYPLAEKFLFENSIDPRRFDQYDKNGVEKDIAYADRMKKEFDALADTPEKQFRNKASLVIESASLKGIKEGWFLDKGNPDVSVYAMHTAPYDDIKNGIDVIAEFSVPGSSEHAGLAIDVTYGKSDVVKKKMFEIEKEILKGNLSELRYFETSNYHGKLLDVPRVVIGVDIGHVITLAEEWVHSPEKIGDDPMQIIVLREIAKQCEHFAHVAVEEGKRLQKIGVDAQTQKLVERLGVIAAIYEKNQNRFLKILRSKPMEMRARATDKYKDRVSTDITNISAQGL